MIRKLKKFMQEFLVKYAHKYAQKSTKICKNNLKYELNMQKHIFNNMPSFQTKYIFLSILRVFISLKNNSSQFTLIL